MDGIYFEYLLSLSESDRSLDHYEELIDWEINEPGGRKSPMHGKPDRANRLVG